MSWGWRDGRGVSRTVHVWGQHGPPLQSSSGSVVLEGSVQALGPPGDCRASNTASRGREDADGPPGWTRSCCPSSASGPCPQGELPCPWASWASAQRARLCRSSRFLSDPARRQRCSSRFQPCRAPSRPHPLPSGWPPLSSGRLPHFHLSALPLPCPLDHRPWTDSCWFCDALPQAPLAAPIRLAWGPPLVRGPSELCPPPRLGRVPPPVPAPVILVALVLCLPGLPRGLSWPRSTCVRGCSFGASGGSPLLPPDLGARGRRLAGLGPGVSAPGCGSPELRPPCLPLPPTPLSYPVKLPRPPPWCSARGHLPQSASPGGPAGFQSC